MSSVYTSDLIETTPVDVGEVYISEEDDDVEYTTAVNNVTKDWTLKANLSRHQLQKFKNTQKTNTVGNDGIPFFMQHIDDYTYRDFMNCRETRQVLENNFSQKVSLHLAPQLYEILDTFLDEKLVAGSNIFGRNMCDFDRIKLRSELLNIIYYNLVKKYDMSTILNNPELIHIMAKHKEQNKRNAKSAKS